MQATARYVAHNN